MPSMSGSTPPSAERGEDALRSFSALRLAAFCSRRSISPFSRSRFAAVGLEFRAMLVQHTPTSTISSRHPQRDQCACYDFCFRDTHQ